MALPPSPPNPHFPSSVIPLRTDPKLCFPCDYPYTAILYEKDHLMLGELWHMPPLPISMTTRTFEQFLCIFLPSHTSRESLEPFLFKFLSLLPSPDTKTLIQELAVSEPSLVAMNIADLETVSALQELLVATERLCEQAIRQQKCY